MTPAMLGDDLDDDGSALSDLGFSEEEGGELFDAFGACDVDVHLTFVNRLTQDANNAACISDAVTEDLLRRLVVASMTGSGDDLAATFGTALAPCGG